MITTGTRLPQRKSSVSCARAWPTLVPQAPFSTHPFPSGYVSSALSARTRTTTMEYAQSAPSAALGPARALRRARPAPSAALGPTRPPPVKTPHERKTTPTYGAQISARRDTTALSVVVPYNALTMPTATQDRTSWPTVQPVRPAPSSSRHHRRLNAKAARRESISQTPFSALTCSVRIVPSGALS